MSEEVGQKRFGSTALKKWQERGWRVVNFTQVEGRTASTTTSVQLCILAGTKYVSSARLTTKSLRLGLLLDVEI